MMKIKILTILMLTAALWLTSCTSGDDAAPEAAQGQVTPPNGEPLRLSGITRSGVIEAVAADIKVLMMRDAKPGTYYEGSYVKTETGWQHLVSVNSENYHIYGYMPGDMVNATPAMLSGSYETGAVLTFDGLEAASPYDVCLITSVKKSADDAFVPGNYALDNSDNTNTVSLHLDHLMASVAFKVALGNSRNYADLRSIKLKTVSLKTKTLTKCAVTCRQGQALTESDIAFTLDTENRTACPVFTGEGWLKAPADTVKVTGYFVPSLYNDLELVTEYDVYDKKGNKVRSDCKASNSLSLPSLNRGQQYTIKLTVEPTYLGQLSDGDLNDPEIKIN